MQDVNLSEIEKGVPGFNFAGDTLGSLVSALLTYVLPLAGLILLLYLIMSGFQFMTSSGDPKAMEGAKQKLTNAVIGFVIVFGAYWLVQIVAGILGLENITSIF